MKNISFIAFTALFLVILSTSCSKENIDISNTDTGEFTPDTIIYDVVNRLSFSLSKSYDSELNVIGGSTGSDTYLSHEIVGNQIKWTLYAYIEDGISVTQNIVFYTDNENAGTYEVEEYHLEHSTDDDVHWISPDMTGDITITNLSDSLVSGTILLERTDLDTTFVYSGNLTDIINF